MIQDKDYRLFDETEELILGHVFERAYLTTKEGEDIYLGEFNGDPTCGLISRENKWCVVGGSTFLVWTKSNILRVDDEDLRYAVEIRQINKDKVEILTDPWAENAAIWEFDVITKKKRKVRDFIDYKGAEYTEDVVW